MGRCKKNLRPEGHRDGPHGTPRRNYFVAAEDDVNETRNGILAVMFFRNVTNKTIPSHVRDVFRRLKTSLPGLLPSVYDDFVLSQKSITDSGLRRFWPGQ